VTSRTRNRELVASHREVIAGKTHDALHERVSVRTFEHDDVSMRGRRPGASLIAET
jgi:hypothetical protein